MESSRITKNLIEPGYGSTIFLLFITALVFLPSLYFDFFFLDDPFHIVENSNIPLTWENISWFWHSSDIPVAYNFWQLIGYLGEGSPSAYRFANILFHSLNGLLLFNISYKLISKFKGEPGSIPLIITSIFLIHPVQVESVVWISSFKGLLANFFMFLCVYVYEKRTGFKDDFLIIIFYLLGVLSKPIIGVLPVFFFVFDFFVHKKKMKEIALRPYIIAPGLFLIIYFFKTLAPKSVLITNISVMDRFLVLIDSLYFYFLKSFLPVTLSSIYGKSLEQVIYSFSSTPYIFELIGFTLVLLFICYKSLKIKNSLMLFGLVVFIIFYIPTSGLFNFYYQIISTVADRYMYIPIIGVSIIGIEIWQSLYRKYEGQISEKLLSIMATTFFMAMLLTSCRQVSLWQNNLDVLTPGGKVNEHSYHVQLALGSQYLNVGEFKNAEKHILKAVELEPDSFEAAIFQLQVYIHTDQLDKATKLFLKHKIRTASFLPMVYVLVDGFANNGDFEQAEELLNTFLKDYPYDLELKARATELKDSSIHRSKYAVKKLLKLDDVKKSKRIESFLNEYLKELQKADPRK